MSWERLESTSQRRSFNVRLGLPLDVISGRPLDVRLGRPLDIRLGRPWDVRSGCPRDGQIESLGDVLRTLERDVLGTSSGRPRDVLGTNICRLEWQCDFIGWKSTWSTCRIIVNVQKFFRTNIGRLIASYFKIKSFCLKLLALFIRFFWNF